jgi:signal transduction histidine kinase
MIILLAIDSGLGIKMDKSNKITEHFFTTKPAGFGTGLGLSIVKDIVENHHHGGYYREN